MIKKTPEMNGEREDLASFSAYCGSCGEKIAWKESGIRTGKRTWKRRLIVHINICQEPSIIYFCNRECKLNWIFKDPDLKLKKGTNGNLIKEKGNSTFDMGSIKGNTEELDDYLKDNKVKILRRA